jgi:hypothetical protein
MKRLTVWTALLVCILVPQVFAATAVKITVVAFGGKQVTITDASGKLIVPAKGVAVPLEATISTGPNSWIDLAQGGLSTLRVKAKTKSFTVKRSTFDAQTKQSITLFKLIKGAVFVRANKANLTKGSKYQIQMPELIAGVVGSEGECDDGAGGSTVHNVSGSWTAGNQSIPAGHSAVTASGAGGPTVTATPAAVTATLTLTAGTVPTPSGGTTDGGCTGGTAAGATPSGAAVSGVTDGGALVPSTSSGGGDSSDNTPTTTTTTTQTPQAEQTVASPSAP